MPSPFPGMDPYLESPALWPGVHTRLLGILSELLVPQLRPRYFVDLERRVYILGEDDPARRLFVPDVAVLHSGRRGKPDAQAPGASTAPAVVLMVADEAEVSEPRLVVRDVGTSALVTVVELLSPTNKTLGSHGREEYLAKRREVLRSPVHLIEVDLLRAGARVPSAEPLPRGDYMVHVSRAAMRPRGEVFTWGLRDATPVVPLPLREGDADAQLDLGAALRLTYERSGYDLAIDYTRPPPEPTLAPDDAGWAAERVQRASLNG